MSRRTLTRAMPRAVATCFGGAGVSMNRHRRSISRNGELLRTFFAVAAVAQLVRAAARCCGDLRSLLICGVLGTPLPVLLWLTTPASPGCRSDRNIGGRRRAASA